MKPLTKRDLGVLRLLRIVVDKRPPGARITPMDLGGTDGSHHSNTLTKLAKRGLVEKKMFGGWTRGSRTYTITEAGRKVLDEQNH